MLNTNSWISSFDLKKLTLEKVDILLRIVPTPQEAKTFQDYEGSGKPVDALSDDDKFMLSVSFCYIFIGWKKRAVWPS